MKKQAKGFTLLELMITIAIIGILALIAAPSFSRMMAKNRLNTVVAEWRSAFYLAQKEAIRTKRRVQLCPSTNGETCDNGDTDYSSGWIIFSDNKVLRDYPPINGKDRITLRIANGQKIEFYPNGRLAPAVAGASIEFDFDANHEKYENMAVKLRITRSGRITKGS